MFMEFIAFLVAFIITYYIWIYKSFQGIIVNSGSRWTYIITLIYKK